MIDIHIILKVVIALIAGIVVGLSLTTLVKDHVHNRTVSLWIRNTIWVVVLWITGVTLFSVLGFSSAVNLTVIGVLTITLLVQGLAQSVEYGAIILIEHRFKVGDIIAVTGYTGTVEDIGLRLTTIIDMNGNTIYIPNTTLFGSPIQRMDKTILTNLHIGDTVTYFGSTGVVEGVTPFFVTIDIGEGQKYFVPTASLANGPFVVKEKTSA